MEEQEKTTTAKEPDRSEPASAEPTPSAEAPAPAKKVEKPDGAAELDPYWWAPWVVLIGLVLYGLLGFLGVLTPSRKGPTAADVPTAPASSDQRPIPAR